MFENARKRSAEPLEPEEADLDHELDASIDFPAPPTAPVRSRKPRKSRTGPQAKGKASKVKKEKHEVNDELSGLLDSLCKLSCYFSFSTSDQLVLNT